jgi:cell division transport system permease protein
VLSFIVFSMKRAWQGFWRNALMSLAATATMVLMLLLLAGFWIVNTGLGSALEFTEQKVNVVADLEDTIQPYQVDDLLSKVRDMPEVTNVTFISRDQALKRFRDARAAQAQEDLTRFLDENPFHASLEINLKDPTLYGAVHDRLQTLPGVKNVTNQQDLAQNVVTVTNMLQTAGGVILAGIALIVVFIIVNTIRLAVVARAEEIEIMRLVGASDAFIRWPFVFEGALVGLIGAVVTLGTLAAAASPLQGFMFDFFRVLPLQFGSLSRDLIVLVSAAGVGLGVLGAWVSVRTYLIR